MMVAFRSPGFIAGFLLALALGPARADAPDACATLETKLKGAGELLDEFKKAKADYEKKNPKPANAKQAKTPAVSAAAAPALAPDPTPFALEAFAKRPSPYRVDLSGDSLP